jgi:hypothetical protein
MLMELVVAAWVLALALLALGRSFEPYNSSLLMSVRLGKQSRRNASA